MWFSRVSLQCAQASTQNAPTHPHTHTHTHRGTPTATCVTVKQTNTHTHRRRYLPRAHLPPVATHTHTHTHTHTQISRLYLERAAVHARAVPYEQVLGGSGVDAVGALLRLPVVHEAKVRPQTLGRHEQRSADVAHYLRALLARAEKKWRTSASVASRDQLGTWTSSHQASCRTQTGACTK